TDAKLNLYQAVLYACDETSRDVCVVFDGHVIAGTRARKQRTMSFNAFTSVNYPDLAVIRSDRIVRPGGMAAPAETVLRTYERLDERVVVMKLTPALSPTTFDLLRGNCNALILETFGIGGIPDSLRESVLGWADSGRAVIMTTQVPEEGLDLGVYEVGRPYAQHPGILRGRDMTTEALVAKTMWALSESHDPARVTELFDRPVNYDRLP
ncbi:MAG: asparaginase domain-containing protein, partial [Olsenella sp.]